MVTETMALPPFVIGDISPVDHGRKSVQAFTCMVRHSCLIVAAHHIPLWSWSPTQNSPKPEAQTSTVTTCPVQKREATPRELAYVDILKVTIAPEKVLNHVKYTGQNSDGGDEEVQGYYENGCRSLERRPENDGACKVASESEHAEETEQT